MDRTRREQISGTGVFEEKGILYYCMFYVSRVITCVGSNAAFIFCDQIGMLYNVDTVYAPIYLQAASLGSSNAHIPAWKLVSPQFEFHL
jgi:hypothetical protein